MAKFKVGQKVEVHMRDAAGTFKRGFIKHLGTPLVGVVLHDSPEEIFVLYEQITPLDRGR